MGKRNAGQALVVAPKTLTVSGSAVTPNCEESNQFDVSTNADFTINNATNAAHGDTITFTIKNTHGSNTITITFGSNYRFGSGVQLIDVQSLPAGKIHYISLRYYSPDTKFDVVGFSPAH